MTAAENFDFIVGKHQGFENGAIKMYVHAVLPPDVKDGEQASVAVCGVYTTAERPLRRFDTDPAKAAGNVCLDCRPHVLTARGR